MAFDRITAKQREGKGVTDLPDTPNMTATDLQARFDSLANLALDTINLLMDALESKSAASNIGTANGTLQSWMSSEESAVINNGKAISKLNENFANISDAYYTTDNVPNALSTLKTGMDAANKNIQSLQNNTTDTDKKVKEAEKDIEDLQQSLEDTDRVANNALKEGSANSKSIEELKGTVNGAAYVIGIMNKTVDENSQDIGNLKAKANGICTINVMDNSIANCKIDGTTDDYANLTTIIKAVNDLSTPVTLLFPNTGKAMLLSNTITINRSNITLEILCDVKFTKATFSATESMNVLVFGKSVASREPLYNVHVIGSGNNTIHCNGSAIGLTQTKNTQDNDGNGIYFRRVCNSSIENINVKNALCDGIKIFNSKNVIVDHCDISETEIDNGLTVMGLPIFTEDWKYDKYADRCSNNIIIRNCTAHNNEDVGFSASVCHDVTFDNCLSYENGNADGYNAGGGYSAELLGFTAYFGVPVDYDMNITFRNCRSLNNNNYGFYCDVNGAKIDGCTIDKTTQNDSTNSGRNIRGGNGIFVSGKGRMDIINSSFTNTALYAVCINANENRILKINEVKIEECAKGMYIPYIAFLYLTNVSIKNVTSMPIYIVDGAKKKYAEIKNVSLYDCGTIYVGNAEYIEIENIYLRSYNGATVAVQLTKADTGIIQNTKVYKGENTKWLTGIYVDASTAATFDVTAPIGDANAKLTDKRTA